MITTNNQRRPASRLAPLMLTGALLCAYHASAQVLEDIEVTREGPANAVINLRLGVQVQYLRNATSPRKDLVQIFFRITGGKEESGKTLEEFRRATGSDLVPPFTVTYPLLAGTPTRRLDVQFTNPLKLVRVRQGSDNSSIQIVVSALTPAPKEVKASPRPLAKPAELAKAAEPGAIPPPAEPTPPPVAPTPEVAQQAADLLPKARAALAANENAQAIDLLNQLLNLPPAAESREAQELIGVARERLGESDKARAEYELFLKLYPDGDDAKRVRGRLAALSPAKPAALTEIKPEAPKAPTKLVWGSVSQYYYGGKSDTQSQVTTVTPATNATTIDTLSLTGTDQSALVTNVDLNARYTSSDWDDRVVFRDTQTTSFLKSQPNRNRLVSLYAEAKNLRNQTFLRFGRQSATSGGVLGHFDGAQVGYGFAPQFRLNAVAGRPDDTPTDTKPFFYGLSFDADNIADHWSGSVYAIQQRVEGQTDRTGVGSEVRYFDPQRSVFNLLDYDATFGVLNIAMLQGNWQTTSGTSFNMLADYRRSPSMQLSNALLANTNMTLRELLDTIDLGTVRDQAKAITPISKVLYFGVTQTLNPVWTIGADIRVSSLTGTPEIGLLPATPSTGNVYTYSAQLIGSGLFSKNDVTVLNASYLTGTLSKADSVGLTERLQFAEKWVFEPSLKYYQQKTNLAVKMTRTTPGFKLSYRLRERLALESEVTVERSHTTSDSVDDTTTRRFYFIGYRWDF